LITPLIGIGQPSLTAFEPAYVDELAVLLRWSFEHLQAADGGSVYLRLSTRPLEQPRRELDAALADDVIRGGYWLIAPSSDAEIHVVACGAVVPEAIEPAGKSRKTFPARGCSSSRPRTCCTAAGFAAARDVRRPAEKNRARRRRTSRTCSVRSARTRGS
jgi:pyruvate dehydrogenase E1 component